MTSMPASRRALAMIFAPRSWPSRPGFATSTRIGYAPGNSYYAVFRPAGLQRPVPPQPDVRPGDRIGQILRRLGRGLEMQHLCPEKPLPRPVPIRQGCARIPDIGVVWNAETGDVPAQQNV